MSSAVAAPATALAGTVAHLTRRAAELRLRRRCARAGVLALTYDDGPGPRLTPRLLDLLAERDARATFYVLGERALAAPEVVDRLVAEGHELACHGYAHVDGVRASRDEVKRDIERGYAALGRWLAEDAAFRPPYGKLTPRTWRMLHRRGARLGWWTVDSRDSLLEPPDLDAAVRRVDAAGGGVVLLHDFDRGPGDRDREDFTLEVTAALLDVAQSRGWRVSTQGALG
jgi:peptidoglycan-N-acetylglucosamine deacetylase